MSIIPKELENISTAVLKAALKIKEEAEKTALYKEIASLEEQILGKKSLLATLHGEAHVTKGKRGPKKGARGRKKGTGGRKTELKGAILEFLKSKGKEGAHVDDIVKHIGKPKANINAFLATTGKKNGVKAKGNRSGIYFIK